MSKKISDARYVAAARVMFNDEGTLEVDDGAVVSQADGNPDGGAYVQAWVWVSDDDAADIDDAKVAEVESLRGVKA